MSAPLFEVQQPALVCCCELEAHVLHLVATGTAAAGRPGVAAANALPQRGTLGWRHPAQLGPSGLAEQHEAVLPLQQATHDPQVETSPADGPALAIRVHQLARAARAQLVHHWVSMPNATGSGTDVNGRAADARIFRDRGGRQTQGIGDALCVPTLTGTRP